MQDTGSLGLVHWDDPEGCYGEGGGSGVQDWEHVYTYAIITDMRTAIEDAFRQLSYAVNVYANAYSLSPMGDYDLAFDWSYALIESSQETYNQLLASVTVDAVEAAELRQFSYPAESLEEARARVVEIKKNKADLSDLLMKQALAEEAKKNPENDADREDEE